MLAVEWVARTIQSPTSAVRASLWSSAGPTPTTAWRWAVFEIITSDCCQLFEPYNRSYSSSVVAPSPEYTGSHSIPGSSGSCRCLSIMYLIICTTGIIEIPSSGILSVTSIIQACVWHPFTSIFAKIRPIGPYKSRIRGLMKCSSHRISRDTSSRRSDI